MLLRRILSRQNTSIAVIGGGVAGIGAALHLADLGYRIDLYEAKDLLERSSNATCFRLHLGFHYPDLPTAILCLHATIHLIRSFEKCSLKIIRESSNQSFDITGGQYFVLNETTIDKELIRNHFLAIQNEYSKLPEEDKIFGPAEQFIRLLNENEYSATVDPKIVAFAYQTREATLNWNFFKEFLINRVLNHPNIKVKTHTPVVSIRKTSYRDQSGIDSEANYIINHDDKHPVQFVINSTWEKIEELEAKAEIQPKLKFKSDMRTLRVKLVAKIRLPKELWNINSLFLCYGSYGSLTNLFDSNHTALITYEPITNINKDGSTALMLDENLSSLLENANDAKSLNYKKKLSFKIYEGLAKYILPLKKICTQDEFNEHIYIDAKFGVVRSTGKVLLSSKESQHHRRDDLCVTSPCLGLVRNPSMKFIYFLQNAKEIEKFVIHQQPEIQLKQAEDSVLKSLAEAHDYCVNWFKESESWIQSRHHLGSIRGALLLDKCETNLRFKEVVVNVIKRGFFSRKAWKMVDAWKAYTLLDNMGLIQSNVSKLSA